MEEVIKIFRQLQATSGKKDKEKIIRDNADNELFKKCLVFLLDSNVVTGISKAKMNKMVTLNFNVIAPVTFEGIMRYLELNNTGRDIDIWMCQKFVRRQPEIYREFYKSMITKSIKLGCDYKTVNKVIPGLIYKYETQQAFPISDKNRPKSGEWFSLSEKINGTNCGIMDGKFISRQGKPFKNLDHIYEDIKKLGLEDMYVNGELVRMNYDDIPDDENFQLSCSIINSDSEDKTDIHFIFYEILSKDEFLSGKSNKKYRERLEYYERIRSSLYEAGTQYVHFVKRFYDGTDQSIIPQWLEYADSMNMEGLMLNKDTYWENKRNNGILKIKTFHSADVKCIRVEEGEGRLTGTLGKIVCDYKGFELGVGSGFTDEQRTHFWKHPEDIIGKLVTVKYKTETKNKDGGVSLQFPVFQCVRTDKTDISYED